MFGVTPVAPEKNGVATPRYTNEKGRTRRPFLTTDWSRYCCNFAYWRRAAKPNSPKPARIIV